MNRAAALRVIGLCAQCEIALVRRDPVAGPLLAQAARAAADGQAVEALGVAATLVRGIDFGRRDATDEAGRKVVQALNRIAAQEAQAIALDGTGLGSSRRGPGDAV